MNKVKICTFIIALLLTIFGYIDYEYEILKFGYKNTDNEFLVQIHFLLQFFYRFGDFVSWISYYIFPSLKASTAFIIGQILFFPVLWGIIYLVLQLILFVKSRLKHIK